MLPRMKILNAVANAAKRWPCYAVCPCFINTTAWVNAYSESGGICAIYLKCFLIGAQAAVCMSCADKLKSIFSLMCLLC